MIRSANRSRSGFTLAEAVITIALVGLTLSSTLQILHGSKFTAAYTRDSKIARDLALKTLGQIECGFWWDDIEMMRTGTYAEDGYEAFYWELALGDEIFSDAQAEDEYDRPFDNWRFREQQRLDDEEYDEDEENEQTEPFEKVRIKVVFPRYGEFANELILERWIPWEQVYGVDEEEEGQGGQGQGQGQGQNSGSGAGGGAR